MTVIYALADPLTNEVRYVGKTDRLKVRLATHRRDLSNSYRGRWLRSINYQIDLHILEENPVDWMDAERFWIAYFKFIGARLTNTTGGGEGLVNPSDEVRDKIRKARTGSSHTKESKAKITRSLKGNSYALGFKHSEQTRAKISHGGMGRIHSLKTKAKMSAWQKGCTPSEQCRNAVAEANRKRLFTDDDRALKSANMKRIWAERKVIKEAL